MLSFIAGVRGNGGGAIIGHVPSVNNPADICPKAVPGGQKRDHLIGLLLRELVD
jgi:hypothetical protein